MASHIVVLGLTLIAFTLYKLVNQFLASRRYAAAAAALGCQPPNHLHHRIPFGLGILYEVLRADRERVVPDYLQERHARAGANTYSCDLLNTSTVFTNEPQNIKAILSTQFQDFGMGSIRRNNAMPFLGHGIFTEDGKEWERSRAMLRPHFSRSQVSDLSLLEVHVQQLLRALPLQESGWTAQVDLQVLFFRMMLDSATEFLVGKSINSQTASLDKNVLRPFNDSATIDELGFGAAFDICEDWVASRARMSNAYWLLDSIKFRENCKKTHKFMDNLVDIALASGPEGLRNTTIEQEHTVLDSLLKQTSDRVVIRSELLHILVASRDTTAASLGWLFYLLVRHQGVHSNLRSIILDTFGSYEHPKEISLAKLKDCQYLQNCLNETLRLHPPVPFNARQALRDTTIPRGGGPDGMAKVYIKKNQQVNYSFYTLHRRQDLWGTDADQFNPDRWIGRKSGWDYLPFNGGPRICLGQQLALAEISYVAVRLLQRFDRMENRDTVLIAKHNFTLVDSPYPGVNVTMHGATQS